MHGLLPIPWSRLVLSFLALGLVVALARRLRLGVAAEAVTSTARGTVQLVAVGYVLGALFTLQRAELVLAVLLVMLGVAARTAVGRLGRPLPGMEWLAGAALAVGTTLGVGFMTGLVVQPTPWFDPQYLIPFSGMLLGNAMNGASLAGERFQDDLSARRAEIEARLCLGQSGPAAVHPMLARALRAAMIPTLNSFAVAGVVQLPGMMTGQILSGVPPLLAVKYQILIFLLLMASTASSTWLFLTLLRARYLTPAHQLRVHLLDVPENPRKSRKMGRRS